jgi:cysteine desulfurase
LDGELVYLDNAATTPLDPQVREAMLPFLGERFGNPSSLHCSGRRARVAVERAREDVAALLNAQSREICFTASGTEADNLAIRGVMTRDGAAAGHLITSLIEHPAVLETCRSLERCGVEVTRLSPEPNGVISPRALAAALREDTRLVSIMAANNVVGTIQPIRELCWMAHEAGVLFHTDAVQAVGKMPLDVRKLEVDLLSLSGHKLHGPQGVGALFVRAGVEMEPIIHGGGQEGGLRSATENVAGLVGLGHAAQLAREGMVAEAVRLVTLRDRIFDTLAATVPGVYFVGDRFKRLPGHVCFGLKGQEGEAIKLLLELDERGIAVSSGSACGANHRGEPSHVLRAMGLGPVEARGSIRVTLGRFTTDRDIDRFLEVFPAVACGLRPLGARRPDAEAHAWSP